MRSFNVFTLCLAVVALAAMSFAPSSSPNKSIDPSKSQITWKGYKVLGEHSGTIQLSSVDLDMSDGVLKGGSFSIDMTSIKCTDLEGEYAGKLEGHLKSDDFFGVAKFPTAKFDITKVVSRGKAGNYKIVGNLTIKGITKEIRFNAETSGEGAMTAKITVDRSDFEVRYGSGSFFDNLGDKTIYDEFDLEVSIVNG
ncbi:MAG: YceI family protein [Bacteroidota bacterium]